MSLIKTRFYNRDNAHSDAACDAAELRVVHAKGVGKWWVEPNLSRFNDADREQTHKGRKEFPDREAAMKYARGTGKTFIVNDACGKGEDAEKFRVGQKVKHTRFGTIGKVFEIAPDGGIGVQWSNGQAYYGEFHRPLSEIVAVDACDDSSGLNTSASAVAKDAYGVESKYYSGPFYPHLNDDGSIMEFRTEGEARKYIAEQERRDRMRSSSMKSYRVVRLNA